MAEKISVNKSKKGLSISFDGPPSIVIIKAQFGSDSQYTYAIFEKAATKTVAYPSDLFRFGLIKATLFPLKKDPDPDIMDREGGTTSWHNKMHVPPGKYPLGKDKDKPAKKKGTVDLHAGGGDE